MRKLALILATSLFIAQPAQAEGWLDSLKNMLGFGSEQSEQQPSIQGMIGSVAEGLGINQSQAEGGLASLFNYVKNTADSGQFQQLAQAIPGLDGIMSSVPDISNMESSGLSGLMDKAAEYSDSLKAVNEVKKQFEALGLKPEMIAGFIEQAKAYLDTEQGQQAKQLLSQQLGSFL